MIFTVSINGGKMKTFKGWLSEENIIVKVKKDNSKGRTKSNVGDYEVEALHKSGDWAAHLPVGIQDKTQKGSYVITHIPSGMAAKFISNRKEAIKMVNALGKMSAKWNGQGKPPQDFIDQTKDIVQR
jgi:hydrogenase maturation factor